MFQWLLADSAFAADECPLTSGSRSLDLEHAGHRSARPPIKGGRSGITEVLIWKSISLLLGNSTQKRSFSFGSLRLLGLEKRGVGLTRGRMGAQIRDSSLVSRSSRPWLRLSRIVRRTDDGLGCIIWRVQVSLYVHFWPPPPHGASRCRQQSNEGYETGAQQTMDWIG